MRFWRGWILLLMLVVAVQMSLAPMVSAQTSTDLIVDAFDSTITIQPDGVVVVTEEISVTFFDDLHGIYRAIPYIYSSDGQEFYTEVSIAAVRRDGQAEIYELSQENGHQELKIGDPDETLSGQHTYTISYTAKGVLTAQAGYDELYWNVTGNEWEIPITTARAKVTLPQPGIVQTACYEGAAGSTETCDTNTTESVAMFTNTEALQAGEGMTVAVGFTKAMVPIVHVEKPKTAAEQVVEQAANPAIISLAIISLIGGITLPWWLWYRRGRDKWWKQPEMLQATTQTASLKPWNRKPQVVVEFEPPLDLRPAQIGLLIDQKADTLDVTSTIIDLASRGFLTITELDKTWIFGSKDYQLDRIAKSSASLLEYETLLLNGIFDGKKSVKLSSLKNSFYTELDKVKDAIRQDLMSRGYFVASPKKVRSTYLGIGATVLALGVGGVVAGIAFVSAWIVAAAVFALVAGLGIMVMSNAMPQRTAKGFEAYRQVLGYELFISTAETHRQRFFEDKNTFTQALPYAMVFGLTDKFAKAMEQIGYQPPQPTWYHGLYAFNLMHFSQGMNEVSKAFSSTMASTPSSSGSGGGGFSGGGFGGGGGGGW